MQAGFTPNAAHLGTPLDHKVLTPDAARVQSSFAQAVFDNSMLYADASVDERNIVYRKQAPALQGMNLTHVPTGGFSNKASIIVGADESGVTYNTRLPSLFTQPENPDRRVTIMPEGPLTGVGGAPTVYREPDGKHRNVHGAMSVGRAQQEAALGLARRDAAQQSAIAGTFLDPTLRRTSTPVRLAELPPAQQQPAATTAAPTRPSPIPITPATSDGIPANFWTAFTTAMDILFVKAPHGAKIPPTTWAYLVLLIVFVLGLIFFIVMVVRCAQYDVLRSRQ